MSNKERDLLDGAFQAFSDNDPSTDADPFVEIYYEQELADIHLKNSRTRAALLDFVHDNSKEIVGAIQKREDEKRKFRKRIVLFLSIAFGISLAFGMVMIVLDAFGCISLPREIFISFFTTVVAQIISLMLLFVRHANDTEVLKMHEATTHKLLDYLISSDSQSQKK